ncbi:hypothetical protein C8F01DRAFT_1170928, partial [Mycena amicta]
VIVSLSPSTNEKQPLPAPDARLRTRWAGGPSYGLSLSSWSGRSSAAGAGREHMEYRTTRNRTTRDGGFRDSEAAWVVLSVYGRVPHALSRSLAGLEGCRWGVDPSRGSPDVSSATLSTATGISFPALSRRRGRPSAAHTLDDDEALPARRIACCSIFQAGCGTSSLISFHFAELVSVSVSHPLRMGPSSAPPPRSQLHGMHVLPQVVHYPQMDLYRTGRAEGGKS